MAAKKKSIQKTTNGSSVIAAAESLIRDPVAKATPIDDMPWIEEGTEFDIRLAVRVRLIEPMLGTVPMSPEIYLEHIISKLRKELLKKSLSDELRKQYEERLVEAERGETETVQESEEKGYTSFHVDVESGELFMYDYMIRGFFKAAAEAIKDRENRGKDKGNKIIPWNHKAMVDEQIFVLPRRIMFGKRSVDGQLERPLRAMTPKGPRVALARSDFIDLGTEFEFEIGVIDRYKVSKKTIEQLLKYGRWKGLGQFRNGSYGRFVFKLLDVTPKKEKEEKKE